MRHKTIQLYVTWIGLIQQTPLLQADRRRPVAERIEKSAVAFEIRLVIDTVSLRLQYKSVGYVWHSRKAHRTVMEILKQSFENRGIKSGNRPLGPENFQVTVSNEWKVSFHDESGLLLVGSSQLLSLESGKGYTGTFVPLHSAHKMLHDGMMFLNLT